MLKIVAVYAAVLVITLFGEQCNSIEIYLQDVVENNLENEDLFEDKAINYEGHLFEESKSERSTFVDDLLKLLFSGNLYREGNYIVEKNDIQEDTNEDDTDGAVPERSRLVRQAYYPQQAPLYPKLPTNNQYQPSPNYGNQNHQWQPPNNYTGTGYPSNGFPNQYPSSQQQSSFGQQPYPSQPQYPSYNNGQKPPTGQYNHYSNVSSASPYPGFKQPNTTMYNPGSSRPPYHQHGQFNNNTYSGYPPSAPSYGPSNTSNLYNSAQRPALAPYTTPSNRYPVNYDRSTNRPGQSPYNNYNTSNWAGSSLNHTNSPSARPPYNYPNGQNPQYFNSHGNNPYAHQHGQFNNNTYSGYPPSAPSYGPSNISNPYNSAQRPALAPYTTPGNGYPVQTNSTYPHNVPNQNMNHNPANGYHPGQNPSYNMNNNASYWNGYNMNNTNVPGGRQPYNNGNKPQPFNSNPQNSGQNPYQNQYNGQYPGGQYNGYPSNSHGSDTFNPANGYNPSIPNRPSYGNGPEQNQGQYPPGSNGYQDPTKVSPDHFSYPY